MVGWPFGRRSRRPSEATADTSTTYPTESIQSIHSSKPPARRPSKGSRRRRRTGSTKNSTKPEDTRNLQVTTLAPIQPLSPIGSRFGDRPRTPDSQASAENITALPQSRELRTSPHLRPATRNDADIPYDFRIYNSNSRLGTPTPPVPQNQQPLQRQGSQRPKYRLARSSSGNKKRSAADRPKKISKKRRSSDPVREEEIRAMSAPAVVPRPVARGDSGILRRDSKKVRDGLNRNFERPMSNISLPKPDSGPSSRKGAVDGRSYRISVMDIMSPRPVIRVSEPYSMVALGYPFDSSRGKGPRRSTSPSKEARKGSRRVHDLADDLDSTELRAAMDRERRRKEQKKSRDAEKLKQRLERRAEKERAKEEAADDAAMGALGAAVAAVVAEQSSPKRKERRSPKAEWSLPGKAHSSEPATPSRAPPARPTPPQLETPPRQSPPRELPGESPQTEPAQPTRAAPEPSEAEPVLDLAAVEPPESFAPLENADRHEHIIHEEEFEDSREPSTRVSPLLPPGGDDIPGLPFLGSVSSGIETPIQSPFSSSFPTHIGDHDDAAPPPVVHLDPHNSREKRYSSLSPAGHHQAFASSSSVTALPDVSGHVEQGQKDAERKRKRRPSLLLSFFRRGDKRKSRNRSASDGEAARVDSGMSFSREDPRLRVGSGAAVPQNIHSDISPQSSKYASPVRSHSKFREDLPGLNIQHLDNSQLPSPPASRLHSPVPQLAASSPDQAREAMITPISAKQMDEHSEYEVIPEEELHQNKSPVGMSNPLTQSLASIDSEGSWFTGRRAKRGMSGLSGTIRNPGSQRNSGSHHETRQSGRSSPYDSGLEPVADKFDNDSDLDVSRHLRHNNSGGPPSLVGRKPSEETIGKPSIYTKRWEADNAILRKEGAFKVYGDVAKQPELRQGMRVKSSEALLKEALAAAVVVDEGLREKDMALHDPDSDDPDTPEIEKPQLHRATSVKTRRIYSDDAKLIEVPTRGSREAVHSTPPLGVSR